MNPDGNFNYVTRARAKADAQSLLQQHSQVQSDEHRDQHHDWTEDDDDDDEEEEESAHLRARQAKAKTSYETVCPQQSISTYGNQPVGHSHNQHRGELESRRGQEYSEPSQYQKSPQLKRRPLPTPKVENDSRFYNKPTPQSELQSANRFRKPIAPRGIQKNKSQDKSSKYNRLKLAILFIIVTVVTGYLLYLIRMGMSPASQSFVHVLKKFEEKPESFLPRFPNQSPDNWRKIRSMVKATTALAFPRSPGVITLVSLKDSEPVANCMGRTLAFKLQAAYNDLEFVSLRGMDYEGRDAEKVKMEVDRRIRQGLQNGAHVVLLEGLHHLPAESGLLFNGLCDNDNAPFKQAIYIFTSVTDKIVTAAYQQVTRFWKDSIAEDQRHSLETRIGNNIIIIYPEKNNSFYKECMQPFYPT